MDPNMPCRRLKHSKEHGMFLQSTPAPFQHISIVYMLVINSDPDRIEASRRRGEEEEKKDTHLD
jgi:hypothetical protein